MRHRVRRSSISTGMLLMLAPRFGHAVQAIAVGPAAPRARQQLDHRECVAAWRSRRRSPTSVSPPSDAPMTRSGSALASAPNTASATRKPVSPRVAGRRGQHAVEDACRAAP